MKNTFLPFTGCLKRIAIFYFRAKREVQYKTSCPGKGAGLDRVFSQKSVHDFFFDRALRGFVAVGRVPLEAIDKVAMIYNLRTLLEGISGWSRLRGLFDRDMLIA